MTVTEEFYNVECDCCHSLVSDEQWLSNEDAIRDAVMPDSDWKQLRGFDYCPKCWYYNDDGNIVTADGKVWDEDTETILSQA